MTELADGTFDPSAKREPLQYLVGVCEMGADGRIRGTHHVSSTVATSLNAAKAWAINDTACDWGYDAADIESLHVLFVMTTPVGVNIDFVEYDEGVQT